MYSLKANFYPASEPKNGYVGRADVTISNAVRLNNIAVFENEAGDLQVQFDKFGKENEYSYVVPKSKEAYAAIVGVIDAAKKADKHFASVKGDFIKDAEFTAQGVRVNEPYADGRFSLNVGDFVALNGITTQPAKTTKDGKEINWIAVNMPPVRDQEGHVRTYTNKDGKTLADLQFEGLDNHWKNKDGSDAHRDYSRVIGKVIRDKREELGKSLDNVINGADAQKGAAEQGAPEKEQPVAER